MVDKILRRYIGIGCIKPLLVDKKLGRYIGIGGVEPLVVDILRFFGIRGDVMWVKCLPLRQLRFETGESLDFF